MSKSSHPQSRVTINLRRHEGPMTSYWSAQVRRGHTRKAKVLHENSDASRDNALAGAEIWCRRLGYQYSIKQS